MARPRRRHGRAAHLLNSTASANRNGLLVDDASDQLWFAGAVQYNGTGVGPPLNVGGALFGESGASGGGSSWSNVTVVGTSGAVAKRRVLPKTTGDATAHLRYTAEKDGRTYTVDRRIAYTFPDDLFRDTYTVTTPQGNTEPVRFYSGGDTWPGGGNSGRGIALTAPVRSVMSVNPDSGIVVGQREVAGSEPFDGRRRVPSTSRTTRSLKVRTSVAPWRRATTTPAS